MTNQEAIQRIEAHKKIHLKSEPHAILITEALDMAIKALEQQESERWIPVSERLPECEKGCESEAVMFQLKETGTIEIGYFGNAGKLRENYFRHYRSSTDGVDACDVIAWRPLPKPYQE